MERGSERDGFERRALRSTKAPGPKGAYSQAIQWGRLVFTAGLGPIHPETESVVGTTIEEQTRQVLKNLSGLLSDNGMTFNDVLKVTVHLQNLSRDFAGFDVSYREFFHEPYPVRTTVGSQLNGILVEIDLVCGMRPSD
jgi:reactive intermediate/imine deaminase